MIPITLEHYFRDKRERFYQEYQVSFEHDALVVIGLANEVLRDVEKQGVTLYPNTSGDMVRSGWRPPSYNNKIPTASLTSLHMRARAIDVEDPHHGIVSFLFDDFKRLGLQSILATRGVWCEHPDDTPTWCHMQSTPPGSKNRFFHP